MRTLCMKSQMERIDSVDCLSIYLHIAVAKLLLTYVVMLFLKYA